METRTDNNWAELSGVIHWMHKIFHCAAVSGVLAIDFYEVRISVMLILKNSKIDLWEKEFTLVTVRKNKVLEALVCSQGLTQWTVLDEK